MATADRGHPAPSFAAAWLTPESWQIADRIVAGHALGFGQPLLPSVDRAHLAQELFQLDTVVLAHDGADPGGEPGPRLIYANAAALRLWRRSWPEQIGLPSRLTAEPQERPGRARMLHTPSAATAASASTARAAASNCATPASGRCATRTASPAAKPPPSTTGGGSEPCVLRSWFPMAAALNQAGRRTAYSSAHRLISRWQQP
jgi:hypothetical protein